MKKNLFFVHLYNDYSGSPRVLSDAIDVVNELDEVNKKILFTSSHKGFLSDCEINKKYVFYRVTSSKMLKASYFFASQLHLFFLLSMNLIFYKLKCREAKNIVIINTMLPFGAALSSRLFAEKTIYYVHESHLKPSVLKRFLRSVIELSSDNVIFVSHYLLKSEGFHNPTMTVVYNGLRSDFPHLPNVDNPTKFNSKKIVFSGSLKEYKGVDYVIELARQMPDFKFILALNCTIGEIDDYLEKNSVTYNVNLISRPSNIKDIYHNGFAVLNLSIPELWTETFGLSILEGMNYGCVPIVPEVGGPIEIVDSQCGFICDSSRTAEIKIFLTNLACDYKLWEKYSNAARHRADCFSQDNYRVNLKKFFNSL